MKSVFCRYTAMGVVVVGMIISHAQPAWAGWTGSMNGSGYGLAQVNVTSSTLKSNTVATTVTNFPSAAMTNTVGYVFGGPLPSGASKATVARILGQAGYIWKSTTVAKNGDKTDNSSLSNYVTASSIAASTTLEVVSCIIDTNASNGCPPGQALYIFYWNWSGSDNGTAQRLQWWQIDGQLPPDFNGDFTTLPGYVLIDERFGLQPSECDGPCPPGFFGRNSASFCATNDPDQVFLVTDGIAVSLPCPLVFSGFLPPIGAADSTGGSCSAAVRGFKLNSTIPVKMILKDCDGSPVTTGEHKISVAKCDSQTGTEASLDATPTDAATTGNLFRLTDANAGEWHFNLGTKQTHMTKGTWKIVVTLSDGSTHSVYVDIKP